MNFATSFTLLCEKEIRQWAIEDLEAKKANTQLIIKTQYRAQHQFPVELLGKVNDELNSLGIPNVWYVDSYVRRKNSKQYLHVDGHEFPLFCAINIPLKGTIGSKFEYYTGQYTIEQKQQKGLKWFEPIWTGEPELAETLELTHAHLIRVDIPHMAVANELEDRWIISLRLEGNPSYEYVKSCIERNNR